MAVGICLPFFVWIGSVKVNGYKPVALVILDGWGLREMVHGNAVVQASTPNFDGWLRRYERCIVDASGEAVGLPAGQMGNSEVGHLNLGAGRVVYQDLTRINRAIGDESFFRNEVLAAAMAAVQGTEARLHLIGLLGDGGVHSHSDHLYALLAMAARYRLEPVVHVITDGRDTPPQSGRGFVARLEEYLQSNPGRIASVGGRYFTMDRDRRWPRIELGYRAIAQNQGADGQRAASAGAAIERAYAAGETDEFVRPVAIGEPSAQASIRPGDSVIFYNFRADRMRQIVTAFVDEQFDGFEREFIANLHVVTMTQYAANLPTSVAFPEVDIVNPLAEVLSQHGRRQFHAAETEKYAHVTYFFNGGRETPFPGEDRYLEASPKVATYDLKPEMSAFELTEAVLRRLAEEEDDFILVNYANPDMVGHTGVLEAAIQAVQAVDECANRLVQAFLARNGVTVVTADHGNAEIMIDEKTGEPHTYHTTQPVSLFAIGREYIRLRPRGSLADVAPTLLELMNVAMPDEMTGQSLLD